jgi:hypothetical protein
VGSSLPSRGFAVRHDHLKVAEARQTCLPNGIYLTGINGVTLRIIDAHISVSTAKGLRLGGDYRLATTLTDQRRHPAQELIALYHERWEVESAFYAAGPAR